MESDYPEIIDKTIRCKSLPSISIKKTIYILWLQGFINAPRIVRMCLNSWIRYNPDWTVVKLDKTNLEKYVDLSNYRQEVLANITNAALSDIIRIVPTGRKCVSCAIFLKLRFSVVVFTGVIFLADFITGRTIFGDSVSVSVSTTVLIILNFFAVVTGSGTDTVSEGILSRINL
jgi:hypothetical protein